MIRKICQLPVFALTLAAILSLAACTTPAAQPEAAPAATAPDAAGESHAAVPDALPQLTPVALAGGEKLQVVVTTNLIGDVLRRVGGDAIELTQLLPTGADPHSYQARPDDLRKLDDAHVVLVNGLHLEEAMQAVFDSLGGDIAVVSINTGVPTIAFAGGHGAEEEGAADHAHADADPHTWMDVRNVQIWTDNAVTVLSALDPANAETYAANGAAYRAELAGLHDELVAAFAAIPADRRKLVTDHDNLGYLAAAYDLTVVGSVIPSLSTLASPSAQELAALQTQISDEGVKAIFVGTTVNPDVAAQIAADTGATVVPIYTGSLSDANGPAATYIDMMRYDAAQIVAALQK